MTKHARKNGTLGPPRHTERGAAILITLVVVALASVIGLSMIERAQKSVARTQAVVDQATVHRLSDGMVVLAKQALSDGQADNTPLPPGVDLSDWTPPYRVPGGVVQGRLIDQSGRFNLNALIHPDPNQRLRARQVLERLLISLNLNQRLAIEIAAWLEAPRAQGAASRVALMHVSELIEMPGMDRSSQEVLAPWVSVLPTPELSVNVNQTSSRVLSSLFEALTLTDAEQILGDAPFERIEDLWAHPVWAGRETTPKERASLVVRSQWYLAQTRVSLDREGEVVSHDAFQLISATGSGYDFRYVSQGQP